MNACSGTIQNSEKRKQSNVHQKNMWYIHRTEYQSEVKSLSRVRLFVTQWTVAHQVPASMGFARQEYWSGLPLPSPGDLPDPGMEPRSPTLQADALTSEPPGKPNRIVFNHKKKSTAMCHSRMSFENTILSERNQIPKNTYSMTPFDEMSRTGSSTESRAKGTMRYDY